MTFRLLVLSITCACSCSAQFGDIVQKPARVPDSLVFGHSGFIDIFYYVNDQGQIVSWELNRISILDSVGRKPVTVYGVDYKFMKWSESKSRFVPVVKLRVHTKNTALGNKLYRALIGWVTRFTKETQFVVADSSYNNPYKATTPRYAHTYSGEVQFRPRSDSR
jgi:hypothetical protein